MEVLNRQPQAPLKGYMMGKSPATQNIALLLMLREWRQIAQAARARRDQLHQMWSTAVIFHRQALTTNALTLWKGQLEEEERPDLRVAETKCRHLVVRYTVRRMLEYSDIQERLRFSQQATRLRLLRGSLDKWRMEARQITVQPDVSSRADLYNEFYLRSMAINIWRHRERVRRDSLLQSRALRGLDRRDKTRQRRLVLLAWREVALRNRMMMERAERVVDRQTEELLARCLKGWRHLAGARRNDAQTMTSMDEEKLELLRRVRAAEEEVQRYREGGVRAVLEGWRRVARTQGKNLRMADNISLGAGQSLGIRVLAQWRAANKSIRQMDQVADDYSRNTLLGTVMAAWDSRLREVREMDEKADAFMTEDVIQRFAMVLIECRYNKCQESLLADEQPLLVDTEEEGEESVATEPLGMMDMELEMYFGKWRQLAGEWRDIQNTMIDRLPDGMRSRAVDRLNRGNQFDWGILYNQHLLETSLSHWQQLLAADVQEPEAAIAAKYDYLVRKEAASRWLVVLREKLWDEEQLPKVFQQFIQMASERSKVLRLSKAKERINLLQLSINRWWQAYFINRETLENANTHAEGNLACSTLMHWRDQIQSNQPDNGLYMKALEFRWERQARYSIMRWMQASSNERIMVRLAQDHPDRERKLMEVGEQHYQRLAIRQMWEKLQREGQRRRLRQRIRMRLADAWSDANIRRWTMGWWRERTNPECSMEISVIQ